MVAYSEFWINVEMTPPLLGSGTQEQSAKTAPGPYFAPTGASFISYAYKKISMSENPHTKWEFIVLYLSLEMCVNISRTCVQTESSGVIKKLQTENFTAHIKPFQHRYMFQFSLINFHSVSNTV